MVFLWTVKTLTGCPVSAYTTLYFTVLYCTLLHCTLNRALSYTYGVCKKLPFPFNNILLSVPNPFEVCAYFSSVLNLLIHFLYCAICFSTWLSYVPFSPVPSDSLVVLLYRSWLQHWIALNFSITHGQA